MQINVDENDNESIDVDVHENVIHEDKLIESKMQKKKRARNYSSHVWSFYEKPVMHSDEKVRSKCKYCLKDYVGGDNKNETSTLQRHMGKCDEFIKFEDEDVSQMGKSQLDTYLEEANLSNKYHPNLDVLQYWKDNQAQFLDLSLLASDILSIEITTMTFESAFSIGSRVLNKY
ncbi:putative AC transposase [Glycine soja]